MFKCVMGAFDMNFTGFVTSFALILIVPVVEGSQMLYYNLYFKLVCQGKSWLMCICHNKTGKFPCFMQKERR